jgi:phosphatidylinositol glycan class N
LAFSPSFVLLTISYEGLFYFAFCTTLMTWVRLEHSIYVYNKARSEPSPPTLSTVPATAASLASTYRTLTLSDARIALFFLFLLQSAFFSTGNIASISSFSLDAV